MALVVAKEDQIGDSRDNELVRKVLPNVVYHKIFEDEDHLSLQFSSNMTYFDEILPILDKYRL